MTRGLHCSCWLSMQYQQALHVTEGLSEFGQGRGCGFAHLSRGDALPFARAAAMPHERGRGDFCMGTACSKQVLFLLLTVSLCMRRHQYPRLTCSMMKPSDPCSTAAE